MIEGGTGGSGRSAGDPRDLSTLRAAAVGRAAVVFASASASATNIAVALGARQLAREASGSLAAYAQVRDGELLDQEPAPGPGEERHVVIFGFGSFGRAVLRAIGRRHEPVAGATTIAVITDRPEDVDEDLALNVALRAGRSSCWPGWSTSAG